MNISGCKQDNEESAHRISGLGRKKIYLNKTSMEGIEGTILPRRNDSALPGALTLRPLRQVVGAGSSLCQGSVEIGRQVGDKGGV